MLKLIFTVFAIFFFSVYFHHADASHFTIPIPQGDHSPGMRSVLDWYVPRSHSVNVGDVITWVNEDSAPHTVTSGKGTNIAKSIKQTQEGKPDGLFDSGIINPQESWSFTFSTAGQYTYYCTLHPWIERSITVLESKNELPSPKKQLSEGVRPYDVQCNPDFTLVFKSWDLKPACVKSENIQRLISAGWASSYDPYPMVVTSVHENVAYVTLQGEDKVAEVFSSTAWNTGPKMTYVSVSTDNSLLLATSSQNNTVYAVDTETGNILKEIPVGNTPKGVQIHHTGNVAFVANENSGTISVLNLSTLSVVKEIPVGKIPHNIVFHPNGLEAFVTLQGEDKIAIIDVISLDVVDVIQAGSMPHNLDITPDGKTLFVTNIGTNDVSVIDLDEKEIVKNIPVSKGHHGIDIPPTGNKIFVSGIGEDKISVIDSTSLNVIKQITVGDGPHGLRTDANSLNLFVGVTQTNEIVIIDTETLEIKERMDSGALPFWVAIPGNS